MNCGVKRILLRELSLNDKLELYRLVRSVIKIIIDIKQIRQQVGTMGYEDDELRLMGIDINDHKMITINDNDVTTVIFEPPIIVSSPIVTIHDYYNTCVYINGINRNLLMIRRDSDGDIMTSVLSRNLRTELSEYHRVEDSPYTWMQYCYNHNFLEIEHCIIYVRYVTQNKIEASILASTENTSFCIKTKQFIEDPHPLLKIAIEIVVEYYNKNKRYYLQ